MIGVRGFLAGAAASVLLLTGCATSAPTEQPRGEGQLAVVAAFYPLEFAARQVGGTHVEVSALTPPGAEPHDLELTPKQLTTLGSAALVIYQQGFQPALDDAVASLSGVSSFDVAPDADLDLTLTPAVGQAAATPKDPDPHFWLDPVRYASVVTAIGQQLGRVDPSNAATYADNAAHLVEELTALDADHRTALASCTSRDLVTAHAAFGYLAARYGLTQRSIAGISPDAEPDAATMADLVTFVRDHAVTSIYTEPLVSPALAQTLARETGATVRTLDPIEAVTPDSVGEDYLAIMRSNLATLKVGQQCH